MLEVEGKIPDETSPVRGWDGRLLGMVSTQVNWRDDDVLAGREQGSGEKCGHVNWKYK